MPMPIRSVAVVARIKARVRGMIKSLIPILVLISTPALAIDPAYLGLWSLSLDECSADDRTAFRITPKGISGKELECEIKQQSSDGGGWRVRLWCGSEGYDSTLTLRWRLMPNGRLHEDQKGGKSYDYVRCKDNK
jgi:hypothetical protein